MTYHPNPNVVFTELEDEQSVLLHLKTRQYFSLNATGTLIWQYLQDGKSIEDITSDLERQYDIDRASALQHVEQFLEDLMQDHLLEKA